MCTFYSVKVAHDVCSLLLRINEETSLLVLSLTHITLRTSNPKPHLRWVPQCHFMALVNVKYVFICIEFIFINLKDLLLYWF